MFCIKDILWYLNISESSFRSACHEHFGVSPKLWIKKLRILIALELLEKGHDKHEVAEKLSYYDYSHMFKDLNSALGKRLKKIFLKSQAKTLPAASSLSVDFRKAIIALNKIAACQTTAHLSS